MGKLRKVFRESSETMQWIRDVAPELDLDYDRVMRGVIFEIDDETLIYFTLQKPIIAVIMPRNAIRFNNRGEVASVDITKVKIISPPHLNTYTDLYLYVEGKVLHYIKKGHGKGCVYTDEKIPVPVRTIAKNKAGNGYVTNVLGVYVRVEPTEEVDAFLEKAKTNDFYNHFYARLEYNGHKFVLRKLPEE